MSSRASRAKAAATTPKPAEADNDATMKPEAATADSSAAAAAAAATSPAAATQAAAPSATAASSSSAPPLSLGAGAHYSSPLVAHVLRLPPGADLFPCLNEFLRRQNATAACILSVVGSLTHVCLRFANVPDRDVVALPPAHYEVLSLSGCLSSASGSHIHMSVADRTGRCIGGHLQPTGNLVYTTMELVLGLMPQLRFARETDHTFGYQELAVYPADTEAADPAADPAAATTSAAATDAAAAPTSTSCCQTVPSASAAAQVDASPAQGKRKQPEKRKQQTEPAVTIAATATAAAVSSSPAVPAVSADAAAPAPVPVAKKSRVNASPVSKRLTRTSAPVKAEDQGEGEGEGETVAAGSSSDATPSPSPAPSASPVSVSSLDPATAAASAASAAPRSPIHWNSAQFALFLTQLHLDHLLPLFQRAHITAAAFLKLTPGEIQKMGLKSPADVANVSNCVLTLRRMHAEAAAK